MTPPHRTFPTQNPHSMQAAAQTLVGVKRKIGLWLRSDLQRRFRGNFPSHAAALVAVRKDRLGGYDHDEIAEVAFDEMCLVELCDYPIIFWLSQLVVQETNLVDAAGHMGTKFRAFRNLLGLPDGFDWIVYDLPAIVRAGRARTERDGLKGLSFCDDAASLPVTEILLGSGFLQYLDEPLGAFMQRLPKLPEHLLLNKVALREGGTVVALEQFPGAEVPYVVLDHADFAKSLADLGYEIVDQWTIGERSFKHSAFGQMQSKGFYARRTSGR